MAPLVELMTLTHDIAALLPKIPTPELPKFCAWFDKFAPHLQTIGTGLYDRLPADDRPRFLLWMLKRWAKIDLVNPVERSLYLATVARLRAEERVPHTLGERTYLTRDFRSQGYDFSLLGYDWFLGVHDVQYNQYEHRDVTLRPGDVIIDAGAFIGDTAVFFHHRTGGKCELHSFELLDENLALLVHNLEQNGVREDQVVINKLAVADRTGDEIIINQGQSQGATSIFGRQQNGDRVQTITIDDYVVGAGLSRVDFIKMDIEGAEVPALRGALQTIRHFQPRLAICLYHKWDDVMTIPQVIHETGVDYRFAFKWVQLSDGWEAVLHAIPAREATSAVEVPAPAAGDESAVRAAMHALCKAVLQQSAHRDALLQERRDLARATASVTAVAS